MRFLRVPLKPVLDTADILATALELTQAQSQEAVHETLAKLAARQGFDGFLYGARFSLGRTRHTDFIMSDYGADWRRTYDTAGYAMLDPTVAHALSSVAPLVWSDAMYHTEAQRNFAEEAASHGIRTGATLPVQTREGDVAMLSFTIDSQGADARRLVEESLVWGTLVATVAHETMRKLIKPTLVPPVRLTRRETEVLKWIAAGKTDWEMSRLMGISEHGVVHHVRNIMIKYDVASRFQAVAKAAASGIEF
jgi:LuxR family transcriptional regulator, quorum-sensing system regulator LasR